MAQLLFIPPRPRTPRTQKHNGIQPSCFCLPTPEPTIASHCGLDPQPPSPFASQVAAAVLPPMMPPHQYSRANPTQKIAANPTQTFCTKKITKCPPHICRYYLPFPPHTLRSIIPNLTATQGIFLIINALRALVMRCSLRSHCITK